MAKSVKGGKQKQAEKADRFALYEDAVQDAPVEMEFVADTYQRLRGKPAKRLREDFCGSAWAACEWARLGHEKEAVGVDLDEEVLEWGRQRHFRKLSADEQRRVELIHGDVLKTPTRPVDITVAMNFSYWIFKTRTAMRQYFETVRAGLADDGLLIMDCFGGYEAFRDEYKEPRDCGKFTYIWEQADYDPVSGDYECHISFRFPDKSRIDRAFSYHWRLWTLPELRELLVEAGFSRVGVWWQGTDEDSDEGDGVFEPVERGDADPAFIAYLIAEK